MLRRNLKIMSIFIIGSIMFGCTFIEAEKRIRVRSNPKNSSPIQSNPSLTMKSSAIPKAASGIFFLNSQQGWARCLKKKLCHTENGGLTWKVINQNAEYLNFIFIDSKKGWGSINEWRGKRVIVHTEDGGRTWSEVFKFDSSILSVTFVDENTGYISAHLAGVYRTDDGGKTWTKLIMKTTENVETPDTINSELYTGVNYVIAKDKKTVWGYGNGIWLSKDSGKTWQNIVPIDGYTTMYESCFIDERIGWIIGSGSQGSQLWHINNGKVWEKSELPTFAYSKAAQYLKYEDVSFVSEIEGWILRDDKALFHTIDGGKNWALIHKINNKISEIKFINSQQGWIISAESELLQTNDGGLSWGFPVIK